MPSFKKIIYVKKSNNITSNIKRIHSKENLIRMVIDKKKY